MTVTVITLATLASEQRAEYQHLANGEQGLGPRVSMGGGEWRLRNFVPHLAYRQ